MCGIAGIIHFQSSAQKVNQDNLRIVNDRMISRGPDAGNIWVSENSTVGLSHRRLSIIDISTAANQPMMQPQSGLTIVFNGEIYNYKELKEYLVSKGYIFKTDSDTEVLLFLYQDKGTEMLTLLRGMFAFALWDNNKQCLFIARDHFGIKPLYFYESDKSFCFASQTKAILLFEHIPKKTSAAGLTGFGLWGHVPEPFTLYEGVYMIPPGSYMMVNAGGKVEKFKYFDLKNTFLEAQEKASELTMDTKARLVKNALLDTLSHHVISDVPVGVFLSAGLDSSIITAMIAENKLSSVKAITLAFKEYKNTATDESVLASKTAAEFGVPHLVQWIEKTDFYNNLDHLLHSMDQPSIDGVNTYFVSKIAKDNGFRVALSGLGADELFRSYGHFHRIDKMVGYLKWANYTGVANKLFRTITYPVFKAKTSPKYSGILEYGRSVHLAYLLNRALLLPWELPAFLPAEIIKPGLEELNVEEKLRLQTEGLKSTGSKISFLEYNNYMLNQLLRDSDWAGMAHSLEIRTPFVDITFVKNVLPLMMAGEVITKKVFNNALSKSLPQEVVHKPKTGFSVPTATWLSELSGDDKTHGLRGWANFLKTKFTDS